MIKKKSLIISLILAFVALIVLWLICFWIFAPKPVSNPPAVLNDNTIVKGGLNSGEIMEIIKTDKDYTDLLGFIKGFEPQIISYSKLGPEEYKTVKAEWQEQGLEDRIKTVDKLILTDSTYWIELKDKKDETKGLRMILDVKEKKSLLLMAALSIKAGIGL